MKRCLSFRRPALGALARVAGCVAVLALGALPVLAQRPSPWRSFRTADGLADSFSASITFSPRGEVLVKHPNSDRISIYDGFEVRTIHSPQAAILRIHGTRSGQFWAVHPEGLQELRGDTWFLHRVAPIAAELQANTTRFSLPVPILPVRQGRVLVLLSDRLLEFNSDPEGGTTVLVTAEKLGVGRLLELAPTPDGGLWITAERGVARLAGAEGLPRPETAWKVFQPPPELAAQTFRSPVPEGNQSLTMICEQGAAADRAIAHWDGTNWSILGAGAGRWKLAWHTANGEFHAVAPSSAVRIEETNPRTILEDDEIVPGNYFDLAAEPGGAIWLATQDGIHRHAVLLWGQPPGLRQFNEPVRAILEDAQGRMLFLCARSLLILEGREWRRLPLTESAQSVAATETTTVLLPDGSLLFENENELFRLVTQSGAIAPFNPSPGERVHLLGSRQNAAVLSLTTNGSSAPPGIFLYDGVQLRSAEMPPLPARFGPPSWCYSGTGGRFLLAGTNGVALLQGTQWLVPGPREWGNQTEATCALELPNGRLWLGARQNILEFDGKDWRALQPGLDRIHALHLARDGSIWAAARNGLHRQLRGEWLSSASEEGLPSDAITTVFEDAQGRLWAGTTRGLALYRPDADPDPPRTTILTSTDQTIPAAESSITIQFRGRDKWKFTPSSRLLFSHRLDQHDWSPFSAETSVTLTELKAGQHYFQVRALDRSGNIEATPVQLEFTVARPWYQETRLVGFTSLGLAVAMFFAWLAWNRHRELVRSHAEIERIVRLRTEQLERAHEELLHSAKMRALGTLAAGIAHDFNNILSIIKGSVQIIEGNLQNQDKIITRAGRIRTVVQQGAEIVQAMLGFSRLPEQQVAPCDVNQVATDTARLLGDHFLQRRKLELDLAGDLPPVPASKNFLQQILLNFIFNADEATDGPGRIVLRTGRVDHPASPLALAPEPAAGCVFLAVQDFGCGIEPEVAARIFEPFFTTKGFSARRGTGLGLTMVYELAAKLGCGLKVESIVGRGSTFTVFIPIRPLPAASSVASKEQPRSTPPEPS